MRFLVFAVVSHILFCGSLMVAQEAKLTRLHAGASAGDLNGNGHLDIVRTDVWFENVLGDGTECGPDGRSGGLRGLRRAWQTGRRLRARCVRACSYRQRGS